MGSWNSIERFIFTINMRIFLCQVRLSAGRSKNPSKASNKFFPRATKNPMEHVTSQKPKTWKLQPKENKNKVTRGLEAPDKINIFSSNVQWIFQPSQCFVNIATLKMATECHEDGRLNTLSLVFVRDSAPHPFQNFIFCEELSLSSIFQFPGQQLEQVLADIVLSPKILICLPEQLWVGQATGACLYTATHEAFAPCPQLINLLRSSNFTLSSLHVHNISTHVPPQMHSISTPMSLHVHEPKSTHINRRTTTSAQRINTYVASCTWTISKHIHSRTTTSAQHINTYVASWTWTKSKHINSRTTTIA